MSADTVPGTTGDALCQPRASVCVCVGVTCVCKCMCLYPGLCARLHSLHAHLRVLVIPLNDLPFRAARVPKGVKMCVSLSACGNHYMWGRPCQIAVGALCFWEAPEVRYRQGRWGVVHVVNIEGKERHISSRIIYLSRITASARDGYYYISILLR